jgi:Outer membrane protein beta-barrel domain
MFMYPERGSRVPILATLAALLSLQGFGQRLSVGVVAGGGLTSAFKDQFLPYQEPPGSTSIFLGTRSFSQSRDYLVGGMVELHFNIHWSLELNGLFRQLHMTWAAVLPDGSLNSISPSPVVTWEFPVLAKYQVQRGKVNPFVQAGPSFRTTGNLNGADPSHIGITGGLGVEIHWRGMKIAPAARYTRWASDRGRRPTAPDQVELLAGIRQGK